MLSGIILNNMYSGRAEAVCLFRFYTSKFSKVWPSHIFKLLLVVAFFSSVEWMFGASYGWFVALLNVFLLQSIVPVFAYYFSFNMIFGVSLRGYFLCSISTLFVRF